MNRRVDLAGSNGSAIERTLRTRARTSAIGAASSVEEHKSRSAVVIEKFDVTAGDNVAFATKSLTKPAVDGAPQAKLFTRVGAARLQSSFV